jgi:hypothetical protein
MIGNLYPLLNLVETQFVVSAGFTSIGLVRSTSVTTEQNNDVRWLAAGN